MYNNYCNGCFLLTYCDGDCVYINKKEKEQGEDNNDSIKAKPSNSN